MLNSLSWSDRNRALQALQTLTDSRDPLVLDQLRTRALDALIDMAGWKTLSHALPAFILLGRVAGMPEPEIQAAWTRGDRDAVIAAAKKKALNDVMGGGPLSLPRLRLQTYGTEWSVPFSATSILLASQSCVRLCSHWQQSLQRWHFSQR